MSSIQIAKRLLFRTLRWSGGSYALLNSKWRRERLLVLCYHGVSVADEHHWSPGLFVSPELFRRRLEHLRRRRCNVIPLHEGVERLSRGDLPPRSVVITFDDGFYDFYAAAWPILRDFGYPATLYLTTYYVDVQHPVFDVMVSYLAWKSEAEDILWPEILGPDRRKVRADRGVSVAGAVKSHCLKHHFSAEHKLEVLTEMARRLGVDFAAIRERRLLHLMNASEVAHIAQQGCDIQLHTHRHRVSRLRERFVREINDNRARIHRFTGTSATHFCYPGGYWLDSFPQWLRDSGVVSATTCDTGIASRRNDRYFLPRVLDTTLPDEDFDAWVTGVADIVSRHAVNKAQGQLFADEEPAPV